MVASFTVPALPPAPEPARPRVHTVGTALVAAACCLLFAALLGTYTSERNAHIANATVEAQAATCNGYLEATASTVYTVSAAEADRFPSARQSLADRLGVVPGDGAGCLAAVEAAVIAEGPCDPATDRPTYDAERSYNLVDAEIPACTIAADLAAVDLPGSGWLPAGVTLPLTPGGMAAFTLVLSLGTAVWAAWAARNRINSQTYGALGLTMLLGIAYVNQIISLYRQMGLVIGEQYQAVLIYGVTGAHLMMTVAGLIYFAFMTLRALGGQMTGRDSEALNAAAMFWFVTVGIYFVIWITVFVLK